MKYTVYFEFFGRKMKKEIIAKDENAARILINNCLIFHKIEPEEKIDLSDKNFNNVFEQFKDIFK